MKIRKTLLFLFLVVLFLCPAHAMHKKYLCTLNSVIKLSSAKVLEQRIDSLGLGLFLNNQLHTKLGDKHKYPMAVFAQVDLAVNAWKDYTEIHGLLVKRKTEILQLILQEYPDVVEALREAKVLDNEEE